MSALRIAVVVLVMTAIGACGAAENKPCWLPGCHPAPIGEPTPSPASPDSEKKPEPCWFPGCSYAPAEMPSKSILATLGDVFASAKAKLPPCWFPGCFCRQYKNCNPNEGLKSTTTTEEETVALPPCPAGKVRCLGSCVRPTSPLCHPWKKAEGNKKTQ